MTAIEAKLNALMNKMGNHDRRMHSAHEVETVNLHEQKTSVEEGLAMRVLTKLRRHSFSLLIEATTLSQTLTCQRTAH